VDITDLLVAGNAGDTQAAARALSLVYNELRALARRYLRRESSGHTLQTTALVHEAYLRLIGQHEVQWQNRNHFFAVAAQAMRRILVNHAKAQKRAKRGGHWRRITLDETLLMTNQPSLDLIALDEALAKLEALDGRKARLVEVRFFAGMTVNETAEVLGVSPATVKRDWSLAKTWLLREIRKGDRR
jgi:RNA polymerase sigma factor (TIGR02999 family)